jgi:hypothetical protein
MSYAMLYVDNASVIATFETLSDASEGLNRFVTDHPDVRDDVALVELDDQGRGTGEYRFADTHSALFA